MKNGIKNPIARHGIYGDFLHKDLDKYDDYDWCLSGDVTKLEAKLDMQEKNKSIGEDSGESCSVCGRVNTWHPDCPICVEIVNLKKAVREALNQFNFLQRNWPNIYTEHAISDIFKLTGMKP